MIALLGVYDDLRGAGAGGAGRVVDVVAGDRGRVGAAAAPVR